MARLIVLKGLEARRGFLSIHGKVIVALVFLWRRTIPGRGVWRVDNNGRGDEGSHDDNDDDDDDDI